MTLRHLALLALHTSKSSTMAFWLMPSGKLVTLRSRRFSRWVLNREAGYQTSLRWLAVDTRNSMNRITYASCRYLGIFKAETFDPSTIKTKSIFVVALTCFYVRLCLLPIKIMYSSWITNFVFLTFVFCVLLWERGFLLFQRIYSSL